MADGEEDDEAADGTPGDSERSLDAEATDGESLSGAYDDQSSERILPESRVKRAVTLCLLVVLAVAVAGVVYVSVTPTQTADPYTEFYVIGTEGNASGYPSNLTVGETGEFVVGITNHEHEAMDYVVVANLGERRVDNRSVRVANEQTWEDTFSVTAREPGEYRLRILLYKDGTVEGEPDDFLRLWVTVSNATS
jgi:uncharacterized membrane protein